MEKGTSRDKDAEYIIIEHCPLQKFRQTARRKLDLVRDAFSILDGAFAL